MRDIADAVQNFLRRCVNVVLVRFNEWGHRANLVYLDDDGAGEVDEPMTYLRRVVWGMLYADDAGNVSKLAEGLTIMMTVIVTVIESAGRRVSGKKTETMLLQALGLASRAPQFDIEASSQRCKQNIKVLYLGGVMDEGADLMAEIKRRGQLNWTGNKWFGIELR